MKKRFLSLMIAVVMILGIIPFGTVIASAEEEPVVVTTEEELISAFDAGAAYIKLGADIAVSATIFLDYSFTLDVAGYTLSTCEDFDPADMFSYSLPGEFIFTDSSQDRTGKITSAHNKDSIFWLSGEGATVIFQDITIESTGNLAYSSVVSFGTDLQFENCSIDTVTIEGDSDLTVTIGENVEVGNWSIGKGPSYSVDVSAFPGFDTDELKCVFDEESGWWTVVDKRDVIELQLYLKAIDSNGQEIEGMLDVELNDSRWVGTESCDYGSVSCFIGENVLTNWDYCPDGYLLPEYDVVFWVDEDGNVTIKSGDVTVTHAEDAVYINVTLYQKNDTAGPAQITGANLSIGKDLTMRYSVKLLREIVGELSMVFTMNEKSVTVTDYEIVDGEYVFSFEGIAPQQMGDSIEAKLLLGDAVLASKDSFSVKDYAEELIGAYYNDKQLMRMVAGLMMYGTTAQIYKNYNVDEPVASILTDEMNAFISDTEDPTETDKSVTSSLSDNVYFTSANVWFDSVNRIMVKFSTTENVTLMVNGEEVEISDTTYYTEGIYATDFDKVYTFELYENGELVQTLTYSINSYVYSILAKNGEVGDLMSLLARGLYVYGLFAEQYAEFPEGAEEITDENAESYSYNGETATYDAENGWTLVPDSYDDYSGFTIELNAGDTVYYELFGETSGVGLFDYDTEVLYSNKKEEGFLDAVGSITVEEDGTYTVYTTESVLVKAWVVRYEEEVPGIEIPDGAEEITDENAESYSYEGETATYDAENGWTLVPDSYDDYSGFTIELNAGDTVYYELFGETYCVGLSDSDTEADYYNYEGEGFLDAVGFITVEKDGTYTIYAYDNVTIKAWVVRAEKEDSVIFKEVTDETTQLADAFLYGTYDAKIGWTPTAAPSDAHDGYYAFFGISVPENYYLYVEFSELVSYWMDIPASEDDIIAERQYAFLPGGEAYLIRTVDDVTLRAYLVSVEEITDQTGNLEALFPDLGGQPGTYDAELGWSGTSLSPSAERFVYFTINAKAGDVMVFEFSEAVGYVFADVQDGLVETNEASSFVVWTVEADGCYALATESDVFVRAYYASSENGGATDALKGEVTDENEALVEGFVYGTYDEENGWTPERDPSGDDENAYHFFGISVPENYYLYLEFSEPVDYFIDSRYDDKTDVIGKNAQDAWLMGGEDYLVVVYNEANLRAYLIPTDEVPEIEIPEIEIPGIKLPEGVVEITDENENIIIENTSGTYDEASGWTVGYNHELFAVQIPEGAKFYLVFSEETQYIAYGHDPEDGVRTGTSKVVIMEGGHGYWIQVFTSTATIRAYIG